MSVIYDPTVNQNRAVPVSVNDQTDSTQSTRQFSFAEAHSLIGDLSKPNAKIYWADFLLSAVGGHVAFGSACYLLITFGGWSAFGLLAVSYFVAVILYMRAAMFIHELVHLPKDGFRGFRVAWNALFGIWFLVPSFLYYPHVDHHRRKHYGTKHDGEYLSLSHHSQWMIIGFIVQAAIIPFLAIFRFLVLSPFCWISPRVRAYIH